MPEIHINRLALKLSGLTGYPAERLVRLVAERLAISTLPRGRGPIGAIQLHIVEAGNGAEAMAQRIVDGLLSELTRGL